jgi:hypothetical protein
MEKSWACSREELGIRLSVGNRPGNKTQVMLLVWELGQGEFVSEPDVLFFAESRGILPEVVLGYLDILWLDGKLDMKINGWCYRPNP